MQKELTLNDILSMEAACSVLMQKCREARLKLQPVSTEGNQKPKKGELTEAQKTKIINRHTKNLLRRVS